MLTSAGAFPAMVTPPCVDKESEWTMHQANLS
jgi:hypothetical protein